MSSAVHLALLVPDLTGGGAERVMVNLAGGLVALGHRVDMVVLAERGQYRDQVAPGVRIVSLGVERARNSVPALARYLRANRPAGLISALGHVNVAAIIANGLAGRPTRVLVTEHLAYLAGAEASTVQKLFPRVAGLTYRAAHSVVAVSRGVADTFASASGFPRGRVTVIPNPVLTQTLYARRDADFDLPVQAPFILAVGRLTKQKNYPLLLEAFGRVRTARPGVKLVILGEGEDRAQLEGHEDVLLPGFTTNPYAWMKACSVFAMSSDWEGLPTVLIEALACGASVVSTDCDSGPREILDGGRLGRLVPVGDADALADALIAALDDPGPKASEDDLAPYTVGAATRGYLDALGLGN